ncbi:hypothetical protein C0992_003581, partial [Termitomyces sp. T32_za158]
MNNDEMYKLRGYIAGQDVLFGVTIAASNLVYDLKIKVKEESPEIQCALKLLDIYKEAIKENDLLQEDEQGFPANFAKNPPADHNKAKLDPAESISHCWAHQPRLHRRVHFMVVVLEGLDYSPLTKSVLKLHDLLDPTHLPSRHSTENLGGFEACQDFRDLEYHIPFVGRLRNINRLKIVIDEQYHVWQQTHGTHSRPLLDKELALVCCTGPSGIGKTRFVRHAVQHIIDSSPTDDLVERLKNANDSNLNIRLDPSTWLSEQDRWTDPKPIPRLAQMRLLFEICKYNPSFKLRFPRFEVFWQSDYAIAPILELDSWLLQLSGESDRACLIVHFDETNALLGDGGVDGKHILQAVIAQIKQFWREPECRVFPVLVCTGTLSSELHYSLVPSGMHAQSISLEILDKNDYVLCIRLLLKAPSWQPSHSLLYVLATIECIPRLLVAVVCIISDSRGRRPEGTGYFNWLFNVEHLRAKLLQEDPHVTNFDGVLCSLLSDLDTIRLSTWSAVRLRIAVQLLAYVILDKTVMITETIKSGQEEYDFNELEKHGLIVLEPISNMPGELFYKIRFPYILLHRLAMRESAHFPTISYLLDLRKKHLSAEQNEVNDAMIILWRVVAHQLLGREQIELNDLIPGLDPAQTKLICLTRNQVFLEPIHLANRLQKPNASPPLPKGFYAVINGSGATSWDSAVVLGDTVIFVQSKIRTAKKALNPKEIAHEIGILEPWTDEQCFAVIVTDARVEAIDDGSAVLIYSQEDLKAWYGSVLAERRREHRM